jgi:hypothetical protein
MEEGPTRQGFIFSPDNPIYHLAANESLSLCGLWLHGEPDKRRRKDDRRLVAEKPMGQFCALCSHCERKSTNSPEPKRPSLELLSPRSLVGIIP